MDVNFIRHITDLILVYRVKINKDEKTNIFLDGFVTINIDCISKRTHTYILYANCFAVLLLHFYPFAFPLAAGKDCCFSFYIP